MMCFWCIKCFFNVLKHYRATPIKMMKYWLAIQLYKVYNGRTENQDWIDLKFQQNFNDRNIHVQINDVSNLRIGRNSLMNRMNCINDKVDYRWLNKTIDSFKILCKLTFLALRQHKMCCKNNFLIVTSFTLK